MGDQPLFYFLLLCFCSIPRLFRFVRALPTRSYLLGNGGGLVTFSSQVALSGCAARQRCAEASERVANDAREHTDRTRQEASHTSARIWAFFSVS